MPKTTPKNSKKAKGPERKKPIVKKEKPQQKNKMVIPDYKEKDGT